MRLLRFSQDSDFGVEVAPEAVLLKPFKALIARDKGSPGDSQGRRKLRALKELTYIFFYCDTFESVYAKMDRDARHLELMEYLEFDKDPRKDPKFQEALEYYIQINKTKFEELLESAYVGIDGVQRYFESFDIDEKDDDDKPVFKVMDLINALGKLGSVVENVDKLMDQVRKQKLKSDQLRAGVEIDEFSMAKAEK